VDEYCIPQKVQKIHQDIEAEELRYHNRRVAVSKEFSFSGAHHLHLYEGRCKSLHGHTYRLIITVSGLLNETGICVDFNDIQAIYEGVIKHRLDHRYLNEALPKMNTTVENMIVWIWEEIERHMLGSGKPEQKLHLEELILYETPTSFATLKREWME
jgi:6-pyruvoyltetrahydropterin/6-carboxytetrahydropterin synthase